MDTELMQFAETLRRLGIPHEVNWGPTKEEWQQSILDAGYYVTALACCVVKVGETDYLFSNGAVAWTKDEKPVGPSGLFLFARKKGGEVVPRVLYNLLYDNPVTSAKNLEVIKVQYPADWHTAVIRK